MSKQEDYTEEEWNLIVSGPIVAGTMIIAADPAFFGAIKESAAIAKAVNEYGESSSVELIKSIGAAVRGGQKVKAPEINKDQGSEEMFKSLMAECRRAVDIVQEKSPEESGAYAQYLMDIAQLTAESSKEGGFLGIGGTRVSGQEKAALRDLAAALGLSVDDDSSEASDADSDAG